VDERLLEYTLRAREALTIGVLRRSIEHAEPADVEAIRRAAERTVPRGDDADADRSAREAMRDFHEQVLSLSHNPLILELHRRLSVSSILDRALQGVDWMHPQVELSQDFARLVDAVAAGDTERATEAVHTYTDRLLSSSRDAVRNAGGVV
jgi:DNA-binding GntR family transcriptional regulator